MAAEIIIGGIAIPVDDFQNAADALVTGLRAGSSPEQIVSSLGPALLPVVETVAGTFFPGAGTAISIIAFMVSKSVPFKSLPQDEQNRIMDRASDTSNMGGG